MSTETKAHSFFPFTADKLCIGVVGWYSSSSRQNATAFPTKTKTILLPVLPRRLNWHQRKINIFNGSATLQVMFYGNNSSHVALRN